MKIRAVRTRIFRQGENLATFIAEHIPKVKDGSIIAVASKVVALAEGRVVILKDKKQKGMLIRAESEWARKVLPQWWLTVRDGTVVVNAGIDESNAEGKLILLPKDPFASAESLRSSILPARRSLGAGGQKARIKKIGVIITDSRITPLRAGVVGVALGYAGFKGVRDYRGSKDLYGRAMEVTQTDVADSLATAATLVMGEGSERQPLAVIEAAPVEWTGEVDRDELKISRKQDLFRRLFD